MHESSKRFSRLESTKVFAIIAIRPGQGAVEFLRFSYIESGYAYVYDERDDAGDVRTLKTAPNAQKRL